MTNLTPVQKEDLCGRIFEILAELGPSQTTMDLVARRLAISKRTLYEIFGSKDEMLTTILDNLHQKFLDNIEKITAESSNVMEAIVNIFIYEQKIMTKLCANFFVDMDSRYKHLRPEYEQKSRKLLDYVIKAIKLGVRQGVFRSDVRYEITLRLMRIQMESLKRMEEFFPPEITLVDAYRTIALGTIRSIATIKGLEIIDQLTPRFYEDLQ